jgi:DNA-binding MarR family transcriptional regulator
MTRLPFDDADAGAARYTDPATSHEAAASISATQLESLVLAELSRRGPGTTEQLAARMEMSLVTVSPRMKPLESKGLIVRAGRAVNQSGRTAIVWASSMGKAQ